MIELKDVKVVYGNFQAVKGVSFIVQNGEFFTLLGPSGCGKTSSLRAIAGFEKVSSGKIILNGKDIAPLAPEERDIGFVFQNYALFPSMTVHDNIAFGLKIRHVRKSEAEERIQKMAEMIGITEHLSKKISQISGGQQQRVAIARALITKPCLLLMDEPLSNLDAKLRISMRSEIKRIQQELGIVAIYVTHDQEEAMAISDRIAVFNNGLIEQIGTPQEVYRNPKTEFVAKFVGDINEISNMDVINTDSENKLTQRAYIRPEKVHLRALKDEVPENVVSFPAKIVEREFLGAATKILLNVNGTNIRSMSFYHGDLKNGQNVWAWFYPEDMTIL